MPDVATLEQPRTIRKLRARRIAEAGMAIAKGEKTMTQAGRELYPEAAYPAQTVYNALKRPNTQAELRQIEAESGYTLAQCLRELDEAMVLAKERKQVSALVNAVQVKAKVSGLMIERTMDVTAQDRGKVKADADAMLSELTVDSTGIVPDSQKVT